MPKRLSQDQVNHFRDKGYLSPLTAMSPERAGECRAALEAFERETGMSACQDLQLKAHCYFRWSYELSRSPEITEVAQDLLGEDVLVFASRFWIKEPRDNKMVSWHQDMAYFGIDPQMMITFWIGLTAATPENGVMNMIPGTHHKLHEHVETFDANNLLTRGQSVPNVDERDAVQTTLLPGQFSIHHGNLLHNSPSNVSDDRRIGMTLMLMPAHVRSTIGRRSATLLCGTDKYGYWDLDPEPVGDRDPAYLKIMRDSYKGYVERDIAQAASQRTT